MPATASHARPRPRVVPTARAPAEARRPFTDNPRLLLIGIALLSLALAAMIALAGRSADLSPDFLTEVVLYALSAADLTMLVALAFVLARNIVKLVVERRRALPFARFRAKLVAALLGMTIIPAVLVLIVGSELIRTSADRWFSAPIDEVLTSANEIASDYYQDRQVAMAGQAARLAGALAEVDLAAPDVAPLRRIASPEVTQARVDLIEIYRAEPAAAARVEAVPVVDVAASALPRGYARASADRLAARVLASGEVLREVEPIIDGGELVRGAAPIRTGRGAVRGVVIASEFLTVELAAHSHRVASAYEAYTQLKVLKRPLQGVYLSFFLMVTLLILVSATWMGLYLAKRITRPVQALAAGANEIAAGHLDHRVEWETADELGALVDAFNKMAGELASNRRKLDRSRIDLEQKNLEIEARRRYIETVLERIATGVISLAGDGRVSTVNGSAARLLGLDRSVVGRPASDVFARADLEPLAALLRPDGGGWRERAAHDVSIERDGREMHFAVAATALPLEAGDRGGSVLVFDDVTPLVRAQRVAAWRDVARRLAHEIKNPLTPIQLCAERLRRHFGSAPAEVRELVEECTGTIVGEVGGLKTLVDEFSQFARMPAPKAVPTDLDRLLGDTLALYDGLFGQITIERRFAADVPRIRVDPEQIRRVLINLIDNAVEAIGGDQGAARSGRRGLITVETGHDRPNQVVRIVVADNGPGIPEADRDKLFMPYYSTKRRGSGLGLAIVRRIVAEHGGSIVAGDNEPTGTRFTIELPSS